MKTCVVSLVGAQTIPNIIIAEHFKPTFLLFISTPSMEGKGKTQAVLDTLKLRGLDYSATHSILEVTEDSIVDLQAKVTEWLNGQADEYQFIVNLTGGTKIMSIAAYDLFADYDSSMVYVPIPKNEFLRPFPKRRPKKSESLTARLSVTEYLTAHSFTISNKDHLGRFKEECLERRETTLFIYDHYMELYLLLKTIGQSLRTIKRDKIKKGYDFYLQFETSTESQKQFLHMFGFQYDGVHLSKKIYKSESDYLRGGWLEERLYLAAVSILPEVCDVQINVSCKDPKGNPNEFDVLFTFENVLYLIECKSLGAVEGNEDGGGLTINAFLYKLGALRQNFGLTPRAFLATTSDDIFNDKGELKDNLRERALQFGTRIIPLLKVPDLERWLREAILGA